jgi:hypothetical protein
MIGWFASIGFLRGLEVSRLVGLQLGEAFDSHTMGQDLRTPADVFQKQDRGIRRQTSGSVGQNQMHNARSAYQDISRLVMMSCHFL